MPDQFRPGIPLISQFVHPTFRIETTLGVCNCRAQEATTVVDEQWASINLLFPRISLQQSLNTYTNETLVTNCPVCNQLRRESVRRQLVHATPVIGITIARVDHATSRRIPDLVNVQNQITMPMVESGALARYEITSAIQEGE